MNLSKATTDELVKKHKTICKELEETFEKKNKDYGNSFFVSTEKYGEISALTRISDKFLRLETLILSGKKFVKESIRDTVMDLANYLIMFVIHIDNKETGGSK